MVRTPEGRECHPNSMPDPKRRKLVKGYLSIFNNLTDALLIEILIRLPNSKEAIRCKLVCKRFSSDYFVTTSTFYHRDKEVKTILPFTLVLFLGRKNNYISVDYVECPKPKRGISSSHVDLGFLLKDKLLCLEASYGDLILCSSAGRRNNYSFCNSLTRQSFILPPSLYTGGCIGFVINDRYEYRVLRYFPRSGRNIKGEIFSSENGRWTQFVVTPPRTLEDFRDDTKNSLIAFDPFTTNDDQILHIIELPLVARDIPPYHFQLSCKLGVCRGHLRFAQVTLLPSSSRCIRVWELEEDYTMEKWTLVHQRIPTFTLPKRSDDTNVFYVLAFHPNNEDLICCRAGACRVVVYNLRTDKVESCIRPSIFKPSGSPEVLAPSCSALQVLQITQNWWPTSPF